MSIKFFFKIFIAPSYNPNSLSRRSRNQRGKIGNPKSQYLNPKQIPNPKFQIQKGVMETLGL